MEWWKYLHVYTVKYHIPLNKIQTYIYIKFHIHHPHIQHSRSHFQTEKHVQLLQHMLLKHTYFHLINKWNKIFCGHNAVIHSQIT